MDDIKKKSFLISEILRLNPPFPTYTNPVLLDSKYDEINMTKTNTFRYINNDGKYKRATLLNKAVINHMRGEKYNHHMITHFDISVY